MIKMDLGRLQVLHEVVVHDGALYQISRPEMKNINLNWGHSRYSGKRRNQQYEVWSISR